MTLRFNSLAKLAVALLVAFVVIVGVWIGLPYSIAYALQARTDGDYWIAFPIFRFNSYLGDPQASAILGTMYLLGQGVTVDGEKAERWLLIAANKGIPDAQGLLGLMYTFGKSVPKDIEKGRFWLIKAAAGGDAESANALQRFYRGQAL